MITENKHIIAFTSFAMMVIILHLVFIISL